MSNWGGKKKHHNIEVVSSKGSAWSMRLTDTKSYNKWTRRRIILQWDASQSLTLIGYKEDQKPGNYVCRCLLGRRIQKERIWIHNTKICLIMDLHVCAWVCVFLCVILCCFCVIVCCFSVCYLVLRERQVGERRMCQRWGSWWKDRAESYCESMKKCKHYVGSYFAS